MTEKIKVITSVKASKENVIYAVLMLACNVDTGIFFCALFGSLCLFTANLHY